MFNTKHNNGNNKLPCGCAYVFLLINSKKSILIFRMTPVIVLRHDRFATILEELGYYKYFRTNNFHEHIMVSQ